MANTQANNQVAGRVVELLPATTFKVEMEDGTFVHAYLSGKMRVNYIRILPGDRVLLELSPYDKNKGRVVQRLK